MDCGTQGLSFQVASGMTEKDQVLVDFVNKKKVMERVIINVSAQPDNR